MFCSKCGKEVNDSAGFCIYCGAPQGGATVGTKRKSPKSAIIVAVIVAVSLIPAIIGIAAVSSSSGLSGT